MKQARFGKRSAMNACLGIFVLAGFLAGVFTAAAPLQAAAKPEVAVMPFVKGRDPQDAGKTLTCPFGRLCFEEDSLKENADRMLTEMAQQMLVSRLEHRVVPLEVVRKAYAAEMFDPVRETPMNAVQEVGSALEVDYVLAGNVWRFRERVGEAYGVQEPASVAFSLYLINMENGKTVWQKTFNETQQSLSENLLRAREFFKRGVKWLTAEELARYGMTDIMESFPVK